MNAQSSIRSSNRTKMHHRTRRTGYWLFLSSICVVYFAAIASLLVQYDGLIGSRGLLPSANVVQPIAQQAVSDGLLHTYARSPTIAAPLLVYFGESVGVDAIHKGLCLLGLVIAAVGALGCHHVLVFAALWLIYQSLVIAGQTFLSFQWDILLLEVGWLAMLGAGITTTQPRKNVPVLWLMRFLLFKLMIMSGVVKLQAKCPTWDSLTALEYHFATQCLPHGLSWFAHQLPPLLLRLGVAATLVIEIPLAFLLVLPFTTIRRVGAVLQIVLQLMILATGNYNFFNLLTCVLCIPVWLSDDSRRSAIRKKSRRSRAAVLWQLVIGVAVTLGASWWMFDAHADEHTGHCNVIPKRTVADVNQFVQPGLIAVLLLVAICILGSGVRQVQRDSASGWRVGNVFSALVSIPLCIACLANCSVPLVAIAGGKLPAVPSASLAFDLYKLGLPFSTSSGYGLFRRMTGVGEVPAEYSDTAQFGWGGLAPSVVARPEIVLEVLQDDGLWHEVNFRYKPTDIHQAPMFIVPHQPRLDWQMWFAALGSYHHNPWFVHLAYRLLRDDTHEIQDLLDVSAQDKQSRPKAVQAWLYHYDFTRYNTSWVQRHPQSTAPVDGAWWARTRVGQYLPPITSTDRSLQQFLTHYSLLNDRQTSSTQCTHTICGWIDFLVGGFRSTGDHARSVQVAVLALVVVSLSSNRF